MEKVSIKETLEMADGIQVFAVAGAAIAADGKLSTGDLAHVLGVIKRYQVIVLAMKGLENIPKELKDLDDLEVAQLGLKLVEIVNAVRDELNAGSSS